MLLVGGVKGDLTALSTSAASKSDDTPHHGFIDKAHKIKCGGTVRGDELIVDEIV
jgi:hypothetical protein